MRKTLSLILALALMFTMASFASAASVLDTLNIAREDTLIVEYQNPITTPGQFNPYMNGTQKGSGIQQLVYEHLWEMDTVKGEQFPAMAADFPESNEDFTEHTFHIREGQTWSDGEPITAHDVAYTFNAVMSNSNVTYSAVLNGYGIESVEATDDYTVVMKTKESFPRIAQTFGVTIYGTSLIPVPEHQFSKMEDISMDPWTDAVTATQYKIHSFDNLGNWILFEKREDFQNCASYMIEGESKPQYVLFRSLGSDESKMMEMVSNNVDVMCEVTPELLTSMHDQNPNVRCWYADWPYANLDDPCSKGIAFSMGQGEPYSNKYFRWGMTLSLDMTQVAENIFDGIGRMSPLAVVTDTLAAHNNYYKELFDWLCDYTIPDTDIKPFDPTYADKMYEAHKDDLGGREMTQEEKYEMFGYGCWKYDPEAAEELLNMAGLERGDDGKWYYNGELFTFNVNTIADAEAQAVRGGQAAVDQWRRFGFECSEQSLISTAFNDASSQGTFTIGAYWPSGYILDDMYNQWTGWDADLIKPVGEITPGQGTRWNNAEFTEKLHELAKMSPVTQADEIHELCVEMMKIMVDDCIYIGMHSGTKFVPTNSTYWTGYPCDEDPYDGPWWWWSTFKYIMPHFVPASEA